MTTKFEYTPNIFLPNDVFNLVGEGYEYERPISGLAVTVAQSNQKTSAVIAIETIISNFKSLKDGEIFAFFANEIYQPDNRITRRNGINNILRSYNINLLRGELFERLFVSEYGIMSFAFAVFSQNDIEVLAEIIRIPASYIILNIRLSAVEEVFQSNWSGDLANDLDFVKNVCALGGVLIKKYGEGGDRERGAIAFGSEVVLAGIRTAQ